MTRSYVPVTSDAMRWIAALRRLRDTLRTEATPQNRYALLDRLHDPAHTREVVVLALPIERLVGAMQAAFDDVDDLPGAAHALLRIDAEGLELLPLRADPDAQVEPTLRDDVDRGNILGQAERIVKWRADDGGAEANPLRLRRDLRQPEQR